MISTFGTTLVLEHAKMTQTGGNCVGVTIRQFKKLHFALIYPSHRSVRVRFRSPQFEIFWMDYTSGNLVYWIDVYSKKFKSEGKFTCLNKFLPQPAGWELGDVKDWSVWRLCQIFELETLNTTDMPEPFKAALRY